MNYRIALRIISILCIVGAIVIDIYERRHRK